MEQINKMNGITMAQNEGIGQDEVEDKDIEDMYDNPQITKTTTTSGHNDRHTTKQIGGNDTPYI